MLNVIGLNESLELSDLAIGANDISTKSSDNSGDLVESEHAVYPEGGLQTLDGSRDNFQYRMDGGLNREVLLLASALFPS